MSDEDMADALERIKRKAQRKFGVDIHCEDTKPMPGTYFGYALNLSKFRGLIIMAIALQIRNVHGISSTTITQNYCFRLNDHKRRIAILRNDLRSFSLGQ